MATTKPETVVVARGRTIRHDGKTYTAGQSFSLAGEDVKRLRKLGFIVPEGSEAEPATATTGTQGPVFETDSGPSIRSR